MSGAMSAIGTKRTSLVALHVSAFGGKADIAISLAEHAEHGEQCCQHGHRQQARSSD